MVVVIGRYFVQRHGLSQIVFLFLVGHLTDRKSTCRGDPKKPMHAYVDGDVEASVFCLGDLGLYC